MIHKSIIKEFLTNQVFVSWIDYKSEKQFTTQKKLQVAKQHQSTQSTEGNIKIHS